MFQINQIRCTSYQDFLSTFEIELVCHLIEGEREIPSQNSKTLIGMVFFAFVGQSKQDDFEPRCFPVRSKVKCVPKIMKSCHIQLWVKPSQTLTAPKHSNKCVKKMPAKNVEFWVQL